VSPVEGPVGTVGVEIVSGIAAKFAVTFLFPFIVKVTGLVVPVTPPLQLLKL
jgi:hypothetical protein